MKSRAAVLHGIGQEWQVEEIEVDAPKAGEVLVEWKAAGLCHSDEHMVTGDMVPPREAWPLMGVDDLWPVVGGHEGAGVVAEVGPGVTSVAVGDHVSASFIPSCGRCRYCSTGRQNLCDAGAGAFLKGMITDGTSRHRLAGGGAELTLFAKLGTFAQFSCVSQDQVIKVDTDFPLEAVALVSCGVATGWGSATNRAAVTVGDTVVVVGIGGIGINAVQGAAMAGARHVIAVDPIEFKREKAMEFGATHTFVSMEEALGSVMQMTDGMMADKVIMTPGVLYGDLMALGTQLAGKGGTIVVDRRRADVADRIVGEPVRVGDVEQGDQGNDLRVAQSACRHPEAAHPVPRRPAQARRTDHQPVHPRRDQRRISGDARRDEHPRRRRPRLILSRGAIRLVAHHWS